MIPQAQDGHWFIIGVGEVARFIEVGLSFACVYAFIKYWEMTHTENFVFAIVGLFAFTAVLNAFLVLLHEMGHALAAWSVGRRVHLICVGWLGFAPARRKLFQIKKSQNAEYAGFVQTSPVWPDFNRAKSIWVSFAGPFATGGLGLLILLFSGRAGHYELPTYLLGWFFVMDAVVNLIPMKWSRGSASDGLHIWQYWTGNLWTNESWAETRLETLAYSGQLVSDAEWARLRPLARQPFAGGPSFRKLLKTAAAEKNDKETLSVLGHATKTRNS